MTPQVLHDSKDWLVVNKPSGFHSVHNDDNPQPSIEEWVRRKFPALSELDEAGLVHRLDHLTSGCLVVAKNPSALKKYREAFQSGDGVQKIYLAHASGHMRGGEFEFYFSSRYKRSKKVSVKTHGSDRECGICNWKVLEKSDSFSLCEVELVGPGRRHQIRAGFAHLGHPLMGDELYGGPPWNGKFGLHAWKLVIDGTLIEAPPPKN